MERDRAGEESYFGQRYFSSANYFSGYEHYGGKGFWKSVLRSITKYLPDSENSKQRNFLDIGSAFGDLLKHELSLNAKVFGVDISSFALNKSQSVAPGAPLAKTDIDKSGLPFPDSTFDCVTALDVVEHTHNFLGTVKDMVRVLKQGGLFIIGTPITDTPEGKIWDILDRDESHVSKQTRSELKRILKDAGLEILESRYYFPLPRFKIPFPRTNMEIVARKISQNFT